MSRNFELMQETLRDAELDREVPAADREIPAAHSEPILFPSTVEAAPSLPASPGLDRVAQEECLKLVQRIFLTQSATQQRTIVFAGVDPGDGCSRICVETARILAENTQRSICLIDGDFRNPSLQTFFGTPNHKGFANALSEEGNIKNVAKQLTPSNLWLISAGSLAPGSPCLPDADRLRARIKELREEFSYVLIDAPALNLFADAIALGRLADGVIVVLQADSTRRNSALKAIEGLRDAHVEVLGAVLNRRSFPIPEFLYKRL